jgi:hypothetical protein
MMNVFHILLISLLLARSEGRTWRRPSFTPYSVLRGGSEHVADMDVFTVPTIIESSTVPPRGGSTATKQPVISTAVGTRSISTALRPTTSSTKSLLAVSQNLATVKQFSFDITTSSSAVDHRPHKKIAKKLKVRLRL